VGECIRPKKFCRVEYRHHKPWKPRKERGDRPTDAYSIYRKTHKLKGIRYVVHTLREKGGKKSKMKGKKKTKGNLAQTGEEAPTTELGRDQSRRGLRKTLGGQLQSGTCSTDRKKDGSVGGATQPIPRPEIKTNPKIKNLPSLQPS